MAYPTTRVEVAFSAGPYDRTPGTWTDITSYTRTISIRRGRSSDLEQFPTGTATLVLDNRDRRFDPMNAAGPYYANLKPRRQIRVQANTGSGFVDVFRGYVSGWPVLYSQAGYDSTVTVECFDILGLVAEENTLSDVPAYFGQAPDGTDDWRFRLNEPAGETTLLSMPKVDSSGTVLRAPQPMTQIAGSVPYTTEAPLAAGFPFSAINIGPGNSWQSQARGTDPDTIEGGDLSMWISNTTPGVGSFPFAVDMGGGTQLYGELRTNGFMRINEFQGALWRAYYTVAFPQFVGTTPRHIVIAWNVSDLVFGFGAWVDGKRAIGLRSTTPTPTVTPISGYGAIRLSEHTFQDVIFRGQTAATQRTAAQLDTYAAQVYGSAIDYVPETTNAKATRILDRTSISASWRSFASNPESTLGTQGTQQTILNELQKLADSEGGELYATKSNQIRLTNRSTAAANGSGASVADFADDGTGLKYGPELAISINADQIINRVNITYAGGGQVTYSVASSITANGVAESSIDTYISTKQGAAAYAAHEAGIFSSPIPEYSPLEVSVTDSSSDWAEILSLELLDRVTVKVTPKTGASFTQPLLVNSIAHEITPDRWISTLGGSARYIGFFVIDESLIGGPDLLV